MWAEEGNPQILSGSASYSKSTLHSREKAEPAEAENHNSSEPAASPDEDSYWRARLTPLQFEVLRQKRTEAPFSGEYWDLDSPGQYVCAGCGALLFDSATKYQDSCGWPAFTAPASADAVAEAPDDSFFMHRTEVTCHSCGGHLGHLFDDGPGGLPHYCINSAALKIRAREKELPD